MGTEDCNSNTEVVTALQPHALPASALVVADGEDAGKGIACVDQPIRIGTSAANELRLAHHSVSRLHAVVSRKTGGLTVQDLGSTNGTFVNGVRVRDADVALGMTIRVGAVGIDVVASASKTVEPLPSRSEYGPLVGSSLALRRIYATLDKVAPTDATVLIVGETGTGKEVVARAVHQASRRAEGPFVAVDCGAMSDSLIDSELFGHERGAFTGAVSSRPGAFLAASGGTLFFDEVGELPAALQRRLLRVLETRSVRAVGSDRVQPVDVRIVAATHRHLGKAVNEGWFREDLYYRLAVVSIDVPPLRDRREDIPLLAKHFLDRFDCDRLGKFPTDVLVNLMTREWPGNVRELRNFVERSAALGWEDRGERATREFPRLLISQIVPADLSFKDARDLWIDWFERAYLEKLLERCDGNVTHAATHANISRRFLQRILARLKQ